MTARIAFLTLISISLAGCESFKPLSPLHRLERSVVFQPAPFPKELEARKRDWQPKPPRYRQGVMAKYAKLVSSAEFGAVTDKID